MGHLLNEKANKGGLQKSYNQRNFSKYKIPDSALLLDLCFFCNFRVGPKFGKSVFF